MKTYERELLNNLQNSANEAPLKNINDAMGYLRDAPGNPQFKAEIQISVTTQFTDVGAGVIIPPAALPAAFQVPLPIWLFGLTDWYGGYFKSNLITPPVNPWIFNNPFWGFNTIGIWEYTIGLPVIAPGVPIPIQRGDMFILLTDAAITYTCVIIIHCNNVPYGTLLNSFVSDFIRVNRIRYTIPPAGAAPAPINQFLNPLVFGYQTLFGKLKTDTVDPHMYQTPSDFQNNISDIPVSFPIDKNLFINTYLEFDCQNITFNLFVNKIDPLTLRPKI